MATEVSSLLVAAPTSGSGKTVVTLGLLRALKDHGFDIGGAKGGPDFIDPAFHQAATGKFAINLDPWAMGEGRILPLAHSVGSEFVLVESMMGLFDGAADGSASGADLAQVLGAKILFVVDCARMSHSIAALVAGFANHRENVSIGGIVLNRVGSERHERMLKSALAPLNIPVVGVIGRNEKLELPSRHLGLVQAHEYSDLEAFISNAAQIMAASCNLDAIVELMKPIGPKTPAKAGLAPPGQRVAIARDIAFAFTYPHLLSDWREQGAEMSFFSPLENEAPDASADSIYLPGGYPELHAGKIAANTVFLNGLRDSAAAGKQIYGECGGYMVLGDGLEDGEGNLHAMAGLLRLETSFAKRKLHLGYRQIVANSEFFGGSRCRAHEFHYSQAIREEGEHLFTAADAQGTDLGRMGLREGSVAGSYMHLIDVEANNG